MNTPEATERYLKDYMPIKFGSPLYTKLRKKYWELPHVHNVPLIFAVADFSSSMSMVQSQSALQRYLFGFEYVTHIDDDGDLRVVPKMIEEHHWEGKTIPSGFFRLPDAQNISAVIGSNAGTIAKFNRKGIRQNLVPSGCLRSGPAR